MMSYITKGILLIFADILSIITIGLCLIAKVPQIKQIYTMRTARGISPTALYLEVSSYTVMMSYNYCNQYSMLSYMEYPILLVQDFLLVYLVFKYKHMLVKSTYIGCGIYFLITIGFLTKILPTFLLSMLVPFCTPIGATSKVIQLMEIVRKKDSTSVSLMSWFLSAFTNLTRIYTVSVDSADTMLLLNFSISFLLSSCVYLAAYYYKPKPKQRLQ